MVITMDIDIHYSNDLSYNIHCTCILLNVCCVHVCNLLWEKGSFGENSRMKQSQFLSFSYEYTCTRTCTWNSEYSQKHGMDYMELYMVLFTFTMYIAKLPLFFQFQRILHVIALRCIYFFAASCNLHYLGWYQEYILLVIHTKLEL